MKINKILSVTDTREYEESGDRYIPIPGSGEINVCDRCGRDHVVHATVLLENGKTAIVGTGCMKSESTEIVSKVKSLTSATKTLAKLKAQEKTLQVKLDNNKKIDDEVEKMPLPEIVIKHNPDEWDEEKYDLYMGDARIICRGSKDIDYSKEMLIHSWKHKRSIEFGKGNDRLYQLDEIQGRIRKIERKIEKLLT